MDGSLPPGVSVQGHNTEADLEALTTAPADLLSKVSEPAAASWMPPAAPQRQRGREGADGPGPHGGSCTDA